MTGAPDPILRKERGASPGVDFVRRLHDALSVDLANGCFRSSVRTTLFALALCGLMRPAQAATRVPTHVACVGDSITAGNGASSTNASYPSDLQGLLGNGVHVGNYGHSGATLLSAADLPYVQQTEYTAATSFVSSAGSSATVDVIIMLGTNDSKSYNWMVSGGTRASLFQTDLAALVDHFAGLSTHPLVYLALPPRAFQNTYGISGTIIHDQILPIIKQVAATKNLPVIDVDTPTAGHSELFPDGVHPNDTGYRLLAQVMHDGLLASSGGAGGAGGGGGGGGGGVAARTAAQAAAEPEDPALAGVPVRQAAQADPRRAAVAARAPPAGKRAQERAVPPREPARRARAWLGPPAARTSPGAATRPAAAAPRRPAAPAPPRRPAAPVTGQRPALVALPPAPAANPIRTAAPAESATRRLAKSADWASRCR